MIRATILAAIVAATAPAHAVPSVQQRTLASTVMVGSHVQETALPSLYRIDGQRPTWFRRLVHRFAFGSDLAGNRSEGYFHESGAGVLVDRDRVLTAAHVVLNSPAFREGRALSVRLLDGRRVSAAVDAISPHFDAAVLRIELGAGPAPEPLPIAYGPSVEPGTPVLIAGNPGGRAWWLEKGRAVRLGMLGCFDLAANPGESCQEYTWAIEGKTEHGSSGGPVVNDRGELVAIVSAMSTEPSMFAAVPADTALRNVQFWQGHDRTRTRLHCLATRTKK